MSSQDYIYGVKVDTFLVVDSAKPYDFIKEKTLEEEFRLQIKEMDSKTIMNASLDPERLRQWREERKNNNSSMSYENALLQ